MRYIEWLFVEFLFWLSVDEWMETNCRHQYQNIGKWKLCGSGCKVNNCNNSIKFLRVCLLEILALNVLTPSSAETAYSRVSGIYCCYLQVASEWCVLWSVYVDTLIGSETHVICFPCRWKLYIPPKLWCPSVVLHGVTVHKTSSLTTYMNEISRIL
jgi:hypothetical protein